LGLKEERQYVENCSILPTDRDVRIKVGMIYVSIIAGDAKLAQFL
jgi:hypothetical protein